MKNARHLKDQMRLQQYANMVEERRKSGLTVEAWCEQQGIPRQTYYSRQHKVYDAASVLMAEGKTKQVADAVTPMHSPSNPIPAQQFVEFPVPAEFSNEIEKPMSNSIAIESGALQGKRYCDKLFSIEKGLVGLQLS